GTPAPRLANGSRIGGAGVAAGVATVRAAAAEAARATTGRVHRRRKADLPRFYLTTAIDYANGDPHIGHAYEKIGADAIARYRRLRGDDVHFLIGMDEHGHKVAQAAEERGLTPQQQVDAVADSSEEIWKLLEVSYDQFIRTTDP